MAASLGSVLPTNQIRRAHPPTATHIAPPCLGFRPPRLLQHRRPSPWLRCHQGASDAIKGEEDEAQPSDGPDASMRFSSSSMPPAAPILLPRPVQAAGTILEVGHGGPLYSVLSKRGATSSTSKKW